MVSALTLAEAPTGSGQNFVGLGKAIKNNGSVNIGSNGAEMTDAAAKIPITTGKNTMDKKMMAAVEPRLCFLSVQDDSNNVTKK